jgi:hypothetical protein
MWVNKTPSRGIMLKPTVNLNVTINYNYCRYVYNMHNIVKKNTFVLALHSCKVGANR